MAAGSICNWKTNGFTAFTALYVCVLGLRFGTALCPRVSRSRPQHAAGSAMAWDRGILAPGLYHPYKYITRHMQVFILYSYLMKDIYLEN